MRLLLKRLPGIASMALAWVAASCGNGGPAVGPRRAERVLYEWHDDGGAGQVSVCISLPDQIADIKRGNRDIGWCYVATGKEGHGTCPGSYRITEKIVDKYSNCFGWIEDEFGNVTNGDATSGTRVPKGMVYVPAPMPYWMRITSYGVGMHGGLIPDPGKPASHGCIRMPKEFVPFLFDSVDVGTPVTITGARSSHHPMMDSRPPLMQPPMTRPMPPRYSQRPPQQRPPQQRPQQQRPPPWVGNSRIISTRPLSRSAW